MKSHPFLAHLCPHEPTHAIFPDGVPIRGLLMAPALLEGDGIQPCYFLAWEKLDGGEKTRLAAYFARTRGGWVHEFLDYMQTGGALPIRASRIRSVSCTLPLFL